MTRTRYLARTADGKALHFVRKILSLVISISSSSSGECFDSVLQHCESTCKIYQVLLLRICYFLGLLTCWKITQVQHRLMTLNYSSKRVSSKQNIIYHQAPYCSHDLSIIQVKIAFYSYNKTLLSSHTRIEM